MIRIIIVIVDVDIDIIHILYKIIVIVVVIILTIIILSILFYIRKKVFISFKNKNKKINKTQIYIKEVYYQKPNEADYKLNLHEK